jgi:trimethylamine:corrinoid methyltransferase-like protein
MLNSDAKPILGPLNQNQVEVLLKEAYSIYYEVGQRVYLEESLKLFKSLGCRVDENVVKILKDQLRDLLKGYKVKDAKDIQEVPN